MGKVEQMLAFPLYLSSFQIWEFEFVPNLLLVPCQQEGNSHCPMGTCMESQATVSSLLNSGVPSPAAVTRAPLSLWSP